MQPLVSIICLCYNQGKFISEAIDSIAQQSYSNIECILVDDFSTDNSRECIEKLVTKYSWLQVILNEKNQGMCASFNKALQISKGDYIIDLAADDVLHPDRVALQVDHFEKLPKNYGVVFTDAWLIDEKGFVGGRYYNDRKDIPSGDVFAHVVKSYFICSPTIMVRRAVFMELGGYNPELVYEDYDFFVRSSRNWLYSFLNKPLIFRRLVSDSDSSRWYKPHQNPHLASTLVVCKQATSLVRNEDEKNALIHSIAYHWRQTVFLQVRDLEPQYFKLLKSLETVGAGKVLLHKLAAVLPFAPAYLLFHKIRMRIKKATQNVAFTKDYRTL